MKTNGQLAADAVGCLLAHGIGNVVICAGARNAPLIVPILEQPEMKVWRHFDERSAAFFALGLAKKKGEPVAVVTTSGTAVAELLPAVIEACYSGIPLFLLTADRPERFRGSGAPQAIDQVRIFGEYAEFYEEPVETLAWSRRKPLHLNVCLEEPESSSPDPLEVTEFDRPEMGISAETIQLPSLPENTVVLVGEVPSDLRGEVIRLLKELNAPTWCEAISGLREYPGLNHIRDEAFFNEAEIGAVIRIGGVPSLRFWRDLETREEIEVVNLTHTGWSGLARPSTTLTIQQGMVIDSIGLNPRRSDIPFALCPKPEQSGRNAASTDGELAAIRRISENLPGEALVFLGNSLPIRQWNAGATVDVPHSSCFANRGANGIDGELSTFFGLCQGESESWAILGDLTTLYDLNAPWVLDQLEGGKRRIVVINNGGGKIFSKLPSMKDFSAEQKFVSENHHSLRFKQWTAMWGMDYVAWDGVADFPDLRELENVVIEVILGS